MKLSFERLIAARKGRQRVGVSNSINEVWYASIYLFSTNGTGITLSNYTSITHVS